MGISYHLPGFSLAASWATFHFCALEMSAFWGLGVSGRGDGKQSWSWEHKQRRLLTRASTAGRRSAAKRHVRHVSGGALHWGGREPGVCWCAGAHVAGGASAVLPADSAEQAGTNSPRLMCLLSVINSHNSGWERGRAAASPINPGLMIFCFFSEGLHHGAQKSQPVDGVCMSWVSSTFILSGYPHLAGFRSISG